MAETAALSEEESPYAVRDAKQLLAEARVSLDELRALAAEMYERVELTDEEQKRSEEAIGRLTGAEFVATLMAMHDFLESQTFGMAYRLARYERIMLAQAFEVIGSAFDANDGDEQWNPVADGMALWQERFALADLQDEKAVDEFLATLNG